MEFKDAQVKAAVGAMIEMKDALGEEAVPTLKTLSAIAKSLGGIDLKAVLEEYERKTAEITRLSESLRNSRRGLILPGMEDTPFNLLRAVCAFRTTGGRKEGFERMGAGAEFGVLKEIEKLRIAKDPIFARDAQNIEDDQLGGFFIADQVIPDVIVKIYTQSRFINLDGEDGETRVSVIDGLMPGSKVKIPEFLGGMIAYWIGEEDNYVKSKVNAGERTMELHKLGVLAPITKSMRQSAGNGFDNLFRRDMIRAAASKLDLTIAFGRGGDHAPKGIFHTEGVPLYCAETKQAGVIGDALNTGAFPGTWAGAAPSFDHLAEMDLVLEERSIDLGGEAQTVTSPRLVKALKELKVENYSGQTTGQPYLLGLPAISNAKLAELIGPFAKSNHFKSDIKPGANVGAPTAAGSTCTSMVRGDLREVLLGRAGGLEIESDEGKGTGFINDTELVKLTMHAGVHVRRHEALVVCDDFKVR